MGKMSMPSGARRRPRLSKAHKEMLLYGSGIGPRLVVRRGYRTVESKAGLERLGFGQAQRSTPALLIPVWDPNGEVALYQARPDEPRIKDGKPIKYETPSGARMTLDVHPFVRDKLANPQEPLFVTEGVKKGDSMASRGLCAVALLGVWNWRGTNGEGGKVALPEWEYVALKGRRAYVVFDSDVMLKPEVYGAMARLKAFLERRGAEVALVYLPAKEGGKKQGVDDFLAAGHSVTDLQNLSTTDLKEPPAGEGYPGEPATQSAVLVRYAEVVELFHTPEGKPYATFPVEV